MNRPMKQHMLDALIKSDAKSFGHHGPKDLCEIIFQRHKVVISYDNAKQLCREYSGWKGTDQ